MAWLGCCRRDLTLPHGHGVRVCLLWGHTAVRGHRVALMQDLLAHAGHSINGVASILPEAAAQREALKGRGEGGCA